MGFTRAYARLNPLDFYFLSWKGEVAALSDLDWNTKQANADGVVFLTTAQKGSSIQPLRSQAQ